jgi:DNA modification methylase
VEIFARPIRNHTKPGEICLEPFCGSGSQVLAGEQEGRRVYAAELEPAFVAVALQRFEDATGLAPKLSERGK